MWNGARKKRVSGKEMETLWAHRSNTKTGHKGGVDQSQNTFTHPQGKWHTIQRSFQVRKQSEEKSSITSIYKFSCLEERQHKKQFSFKNDASHFLPSPNSTDSTCGRVVQLPVQSHVGANAAHANNNHLFSRRFFFFLSHAHSVEKPPCMAAREMTHSCLVCVSHRTFHHRAKS